MVLSKRQRMLSRFVFAVYLLLLVWLILFKLTLGISSLDRFRKINLIPYFYDSEVSVSLHLEEVLYNILAFIPLGVYVGLWRPQRSFLRNALPALCLSLILEVLQYLLSLGASDITDVIDNTLGGLLGAALFLGLKKCLGKKTVSVINGIGIAAEIVVLLLAAVLWLANR